MTDVEQDQVPGFEITWREVSTIFAESPLGYAHANGVARIVMGEINFNEQPGADRPKFRPVFNLALPLTALPVMIDYLQGIQASLQGEPNADE